MMYSSVAANENGYSNNIKKKVSPHKLSQKFACKKMILKNKCTTLSCIFMGKYCTLKKCKIDDKLGEHC